MKRKIFTIILIGSLSLTSFSQWIETTAKVTDVTKVDENMYGYYLNYIVTESTAYNSDGNLIEGPIDLAIYTEVHPIDNQEIKIKYDSEEPSFFEFIDDLKLEN